MKRILEQFNRQDTYLIISDYPELISGGEKNHGIAWYTRETTEPFAEKYGHRFVILAEKGKKNEPETHADGKILVFRVFDQKHHSLFPTILRWLFIFSNIKKVYIHSEFCTSGGIINFVLLIPFLLLIKAMGRQIVYFEHNVVSRFDSIAPHFNLKPNTLKIALFNIGIRWYYRVLGIIVDRIIVMDKILQERMGQFVNPKKVTCMPIWVEKKTSELTKSEARKKLCIKQNEYLILYFGFITWYKGADWLAEQIKTIAQKQGERAKRKIRLILLGGEAYSLKDKPYYKKFYQQLLAKTNHVISITGFVPDSQVSKYFAACDLVVYPYRGYFGASGALNYALSFGKPFLLSSNMSGIFQNSDIMGVVKNCGLKPKDLLFEMNTKSFQTKLKTSLEDKNLAKLKEVSEKLAQKRSINILMPQFNDIIYGEQSNRYLKPVSIPAKIQAVGTR